MKRINVINGIVDVIEMNITNEPSHTHPFVVSDDVEVFGGYISNGDGTFTAPKKPSPTKRELEKHLANKRWEVETGGIVVNTMPIPTDDRAKILIEGAAAALGDNDTTKFKAGDNWIDINGSTIRILLAAITAHVQACFAKEADLSGLIHKGDITTYDEIESADWP